MRSDLPVGVYQVVADFGQARGTNTASILPNDPLFARRYGRTILLRENIMTHPGSLRRSPGAASAPRSPPRTPASSRSTAASSARSGTRSATTSAPTGRATAGRSTSRSQSRADALEELKADLVSLFAVERFAARGLMTPERLRAVQADGILRVAARPTARDATSPTRRWSSRSSTTSWTAACWRWTPTARLAIRYEKYGETVKALLAEVLELQAQGDLAAAEAFFTRWTAWTDELHEPLARRLREAEGPRYRLVRYAALGE